MMLVTITITCLLGLALCNPIPQQQRLDEYQDPSQIEQFPVLPTFEPLSHSPLPQAPERVNSDQHPTGQSLSANQTPTHPPPPQTQPPAPLHSSSQSVSSESQSQSLESLSESSQEVTSDESPEDTASEQTTSEQSSESLPNTSENTSEEMALPGDARELMGHMLDEINGDTQDNSLGSEENMRRSRILAFGIPLRPEVALEHPVATDTNISEPQAAFKQSATTVDDAAAAGATSLEPDSAAISLESTECTATGDNGACIHDAAFDHAAEGNHHGPGLGLLMLEEERGELHL